MSQDGPGALRAWRQSNGEIFGSIAQTYPKEVVEVENYIEATLFAPEPPEPAPAEAA